MKLYAFAALLALPIIGMGTQNASADYYCCGRKPYVEFVEKDYYVKQEAAVFDCDGWHCETKITLYNDLKISAKCRNGWCQVQSFPFRNAWVLESCLKEVYQEHSSYRHKRHYKRDDDNYDNGY